MSPLKPYLVSVDLKDWSIKNAAWIAEHMMGTMEDFVDIENQDGIVVIGFREEQDAVAFKLAFKHLY